MATVQGRIEEARRELMLSAARRWLERAQARADGLDKVAAMGVGAADSPAQRANWSQREAVKLARGIARFGERVIGTPDFVPFAPSLQAAAIAAPVARIATMPDGAHAPEGIATGLLLPGRLLLTNYHVFPGRQYARGYAANFGHARDEKGVQDGSYFELEPEAFFLEDGDFDFVIVSVKDTAAGGEKLAGVGGTRLIASTGKVLTGMPINIIQHPQGGPRQFAVSNNRLLDILPAGYLHYETDTERGSSGSPVYNSDWELVALHHCGVPATREGRILKADDSFWDEGHDPESAIKWVSNEGTRVSFIVDRLRQKAMPSAPEQQRLRALLDSTADPFGTEVAAAPTGPAPAAGSASMAHNSFVFSGPTTIHVYAPAPAAPGVTVTAFTPPPSTPQQQEEKTLVFDPDYAARTGYDENFLGVPLPMPEVAAERAPELCTVQDYRDYFEAYRSVPEIETAGMPATRPLVLAYHHFSLVMNKLHRLCMWTASNCDYREQARQDKRPRKELGGENWRFDPRIPREFQLADPDIYQPAKRIDRGHIVRREDNCWGPAGLPTDYANSDSYHWTNCTPQHEAFNQEDPSDRSPYKVYKDGKLHGLWGHFEAQVAQQIEAGGGQAVIFAGPVLRDFFTPQDWGAGKVRIPKRFWKVVIVPATPQRKPKLLAYGYVFSQVTVVNRFGTTYESIDLPEFERQRQALSRITEQTGVVFPPAVLAAEQP